MDASPFSTLSLVPYRKQIARCVAAAAANGVTGGVGTAFTRRKGLDGVYVRCMVGSNFFLFNFLRS